MPLSPPVMLFAAGLGTRMAPLTDNLPKPLIEVAGRPLVQHALDLLRDGGLGPIVANTHYLPETLEPYLTARGVSCIYEADLLDTGGGLKNALGLLGSGPVVTLNTDSVWAGPNPVRRMLAAWDPKLMDALLLVVPPEAAVGHLGVGDFAMDRARRLTRAPGFVYSGLQILKTEMLARIAERKFSLNRIWETLIGDRRLFGLVHDGQWCDVGQPDSISLAEAMLRDRDV